MAKTVTARLICSFENSSILYHEPVQLATMIYKRFLPMAGKENEHERAAPFMYKTTKFPPDS